MLGILGGRTALIDAAPDAIVAKNGRMIAGSALAAALNTQSSSAPADAQKVQIGASFRARTGEYSRTFSVREDGALAGLACRDADEWRVRALAESDASAAPGGGYRMAGTSLPPAIIKAVEEAIEGDALDAQEEAAARERGWTK
jgi:hypothetical protein